jgi:hypothetical protein
MDSLPAAQAAPVSADRLWAEQLAMGLGLIVVVLSFLAFAHPALLTAGAKVLAPDDLPAYGWAAAIGIVLQLIFHELGTLLAAWWLGLPLRLRFFPLGAHATAILRNQPRRVGMDALVGFAGPVTGAILSGICALVYWFSDNPFFLGMSCVGCFYNLLTLIPLLDLEGGWIAPAVTPVAWLFGLVLSAGVLVAGGFNLVLFFVFCFGVPRFILILRARVPRTDNSIGTKSRWVASVLYFALVIGLAYAATTMFDELPRLVRENMGD